MGKERSKDIQTTISTNQQNEKQGTIQHASDRKQQATRTKNTNTRTDTPHNLQKITKQLTKHTQTIHIEINKSGMRWGGAQGYRKRDPRMQPAREKQT